MGSSGYAEVDHCDSNPSLLMSMMYRTALMAAALLASSASVTTNADTVDAFCRLSWHDHTKALVDGPCTFSQRQGNASITLGFYQFSFPAAEQGKTYQRDNTRERIRFNREGHYTVQVFQNSKPIAKRSDIFGGRPPTQDMETQLP